MELSEIQEALKKYDIKIGHDIVLCPINLDLPRHLLYNSTIFDSIAIIQDIPKRLDVESITKQLEPPKIDLEAFDSMFQRHLSQQKKINNPITQKLNEYTEKFNGKRKKNRAWR